MLVADSLYSRLPQKSQARQNAKLKKLPPISRRVSQITRRLQLHSHISEEKFR